MQYDISCSKLTIGCDGTESPDKDLGADWFLIDWYLHNFPVCVSRSFRGSRIILVLASVVVVMMVATLVLRRIFYLTLG